MPTDSGQTTPCWIAPDAPRRPPLDRDAQVEVCVIGAGIAGLSVAWSLLRERRSVLVLDDGPVGGGETGRSTAHLMSAFDDRYAQVERLHGPDVAQRVAESHVAAIDRIESIVRGEGIECGFARVDGYLFVPPGEPLDVLERELAAAHRAGLADVERVGRPPLASFDLGPALRFPRQGQIDPARYLEGLAGAFERAGGRICCGTRAVSVEDGQPVRVRTAAGPVVEAQDAVVATNSPFVDRFAIHTKQAPYRTFVVGVAVPRGTVPAAQFWDTGDPYHYARIARELDASRLLLIAGGEDHKTGHADDADERFARLEVWTRERFPVAGAPLFRWSGQVMEPVDALGFIGRNPGDTHVWIVTGDSGNGITHGTLAGPLLAALIGGRDHPWAAAYDPARRSLRSLGEFARENLDVARHYGHWLGRGDTPGIEAVAPGAGAVVRDGLRRLAVHRDDAGRLHVLSATCTHLACIVEWNGAERTWDCPCHGSRFGIDGRVINGPAPAPLRAIAPDEDGQGA